MHSESTISESFSKFFEYLDTGTIRPDVKKQYIPAWVDLKNALFEWKQRIEKKKTTITRDILKKMAVMFGISYRNIKGNQSQSSIQINLSVSRHIIISKKYILY